MSESKRAGIDPFASLFDTLSSTLELGCIVTQSTTTFRLFAPRATQVKIVLFTKHDDDHGEEFNMGRIENGVWEYIFYQNLTGRYYGYRVDGPHEQGEMFNPEILIGDPYSKAVVTKNNSHHPAKTLVLDSSYNWEGDTFLAPANHSELIIYEAHVRDMTAHESSEISSKGTYLGLAETGKTGGMSYLKDLGVNAIELLPIQEFANIEPYSSWNPYGRNHWGYMTSYYFAPDSYYATDGTIEHERFCGTDGKAVRELKDMVKAYHREGIAVILDIVFNHVSQYDDNPLKYIDKFYYFHCDENGKFVYKSGCGNDFFTERPMARRLILDCVKYWMTEYHVDGFRFDIATLIDRETCRQILAEARKINPNVIIIAEPWGGGKWNPAGFSNIGWAAWNDWFRNGIKGKTPGEQGFMFGHSFGKDGKTSVMSYITGTLREEGGLFRRKEHSINYLESHDEYTLGDFIRLATGEVRSGQQISDVEQNAKLSPRQLALNKFAALILFTSQGPLMIHEGQEFARSKVIAPTSVHDQKATTIDSNSYEKDNETNYLNYRHRELNRGLYDYYRGLIALRKRYPVFSSARRDALTFLETNDDLMIAYILLHKDKTFLVALNGNQNKNCELKLLDGDWKILVNAEAVSLEGTLGTVSGSVTVPQASGMVLTWP